MDNNSTHSSEASDGNFVDRLSMRHRTDVGFDPGAEQIDGFAWLPQANTYIVSGNMGRDALVYNTGDENPLKRLTISNETVGFDAPLKSTAGGVVGVSATRTPNGMVSLGLQFLEPVLHKSVLITPALPSGVTSALRTPLTFAASPGSDRIAAIVTKVPSGPARPPIEAVAIYTNKGELLHSMTLAEHASALAISEDGKMIAVCPSSGSVQVYSADTGERLSTIRLEASFSCSAVAFSPDGKELALGLYSPDGSVAPIQVTNIGGVARSSAMVMPSLTYKGGHERPNIHTIVWDKKTGRIAVATTDLIRVWRSNRCDFELILSRRMPLDERGYAAFPTYKVQFSDDGILAIVEGNSVLLF